MTDKEIIQALEYYQSIDIIKSGLDLINRQQAEISRLTTLAELGNKRANDYRIMRNRALKAEKEIERLNEEKAKFDNTILYDLEQVNKIVEKSIKKFAEELKKKQFCFGTLRGEKLVSRYAVDVSDIDNLVKEMTDKENEQHINSDSRQVEINKNAQSLVKSFAEKLKSQLSFGLEDKIPANVYSFVYITIDNLIKEMVGEQE